MSHCGNTCWCRLWVHCCASWNAGYIWTSSGCGNDNSGWYYYVSLQMRVQSEGSPWFGPIHSSDSFIGGGFICETFLVINSTACWAPARHVLFCVGAKILLNWPLNWYLIFARLQHGYSRNANPSPASVTLRWHKKNWQAPQTLAVDCCCSLRAWSWLYPSSWSGCLPGCQENTPCSVWAIVWWATAEDMTYQICHEYIKFSKQNTHLESRHPSSQRCAEHQGQTLISQGAKECTRLPFYMQFQMPH